MHKAILSSGIASGSKLYLFFDNFDDENMNNLNFKKIIMTLFHAIIVWALCRATIAIGRSLTTMKVTLIIHAIGAPIFASIVRWFITRNLTTHLPFALHLSFYSS